MAERHNTIICSFDPVHPSTSLISQPRILNKAKNPFPILKGAGENVLEEQDNMETEEPQAAHTNKKEEDSYKWRRTTGRRLSIPPPEDLNTHRDIEEQGMGLTVDNPPTSDESKSQQDTGTSPKRSKKMKVDRHGPHPRERSRSLPRRTPYKGKTLIAL